MSGALDDRAMVAIMINPSTLSWDLSSIRSHLSDHKARLISGMPIKNGEEIYRMVRSYGNIQLNMGIIG